MNNSSTGGYLTPAASPAPLEGQALVNFLQAWIVGITGLPGQFVRPRWQPEPPNIPDATVDWLAFGIMSRDATPYAAEIHVSGSPSYNEIRRHEDLNILATIYGPNADKTVSLLREGMQLAQNREALTAVNMGLINSGRAIVTSELIKEKWAYRVDFNFSIRRQIVYDFPVLDLASANGAVATDYLNETISVT